jgi:hypothetical protein
VQRAPGFPCALFCEEGGKKQQTSGRFAPREREGVFEIARPFEN